MIFISLSPWEDSTRQWRWNASYGIYHMVCPKWELMHRQITFTNESAFWGCLLCTEQWGWQKWTKYFFPLKEVTDPLRRGYRQRQRWIKTQQPSIQNGCMLCLPRESWRRDQDKQESLRKKDLSSTTKAEEDFDESRRGPRRSKAFGKTLVSQELTQ